MHGWDNFFVAIAGAAAALTGLIFVGISINLAKILAMPHLPGRAFQSMILLLSALIVAALCLVPGQSNFLLGIELLFVGILLWLVMVKADMDMWQKTVAPYKKYSVLNMAVTQLSVLPYIIASVVILAHGYIGLYWLVPGFILSFVKAIIDAWVLLVEINR